MPGRSIARRFAISVGVVCLVLALGIGTFFFAAQAPAMDPIVPPPANSFASDLMQRGARSPPSAIAMYATPHRAGASLPAAAQFSPQQSGARNAAIQRCAHQARVQARGLGTGTSRQQQRYLAYVNCMTAAGFQP